MNDNQEEPITPGCPSLMPHQLPGGFDGVGPDDKGDQIPKPKDFEARANRHLVNAMTKHPYFADGFYEPANYDINAIDMLDFARIHLKKHIEIGHVDVVDVLGCEVWEIMDAYVTGHPDQAISECYDAIAVLMRMIMVFEGNQKFGNPPEKGWR